MKLNYKRFGEGDPLIVLHGLFGSLDNWMTLGKMWSDKFDVILVDQRNHGQSPHSEDFSYSTMADDLLLLMNDLGLDRAIILGHSMGGKTAMEFSMLHPEKVEKLVVVDIAPVKYQVHHYSIIDALKSVPLQDVASRKEAEAYLAEHIAELGTRQFLLKNLYWREKTQLAWRFNLEVLANEILPISEYDIAKGVYENDTLFVKGEKSDYIVQKYLPLIELKFPNYKLETIKGAGHWVHAEKMKEFNATINQFLS